MTQARWSRSQGNSIQTVKKALCVVLIACFGVVVCSAFLGGIVLGLLGFLGTLYRSDPTPSSVAAWERNFSKALAPGYTEFRGHWVDGDVAAYIFSYRYPSNMRPEDVFEFLRRSIHGYSIYDKEGATMILRKDLAGLDRGFNEWRFVLDSTSRVLMVLYANIDSASEAAYFPAILDRFRSLCEREHRAEHKDAANEHAKIETD